MQAGRLSSRISPPPPTFSVTLPKIKCKRGILHLTANLLPNGRTFPRPLPPPWTFSHPFACQRACLLAFLVHRGRFEPRWPPLSGGLVLWQVHIHHTGFSRHAGVRAATASTSPFPHRAGVKTSAGARSFVFTFLMRTLFMFLRWRRDD